MWDCFLAQTVEGNAVLITQEYACSDVIHLSRFLFVKNLWKDSACSRTVIVIVSGKCFVIPLLLMKAVTVTTRAEK